VIAAVIAVVKRSTARTQGQERTMTLTGKVAIVTVVAFLAGDGASYLNATTVFADAGLMHSSPGL
jgi:hypothetical protein